MGFFDQTDHDNHEQVIFHKDQQTGLKAIVGIHNTNLGPALGGLRMWNYDTEDEAVEDVLRLSRGMTYKAAMAGLAHGGGKAVIIGDAATDKTDDMMLAMGRFVDSLGGRYITAEDVGMTVHDMDVMHSVSSRVRGHSAGSGNPSPMTAFGVYRGILAAVFHRLGRDGLNGLKVAVQGLGNVGQDLARLLHNDGAKLIVADLNPERVRELCNAYGAQAVDAQAIHGADADVFAPCALGAVINDDTLPEINAAIVAGSANNQLAGPEHGLGLMERGILYAPDYVINAGGLIDVAAGDGDYDEQAVHKQVTKIHDTLDDIFIRSDRAETAPEVIADQLAEDRFLAPEAEAA